MVKNKIALIGTVFLCFVPLFGHTQASAEHKDSLKNVIRKYYAAELKVLQSYSEETDINALFELFSEGFEFEHPKENIKMTKQEYLQKYLDNKKDGVFNSSVANLKIKGMLPGLNSLAVDRAYLQRPSEGAEPVEMPSCMSLFEFEGEKISKIVSYW